MRRFGFATRTRVFHEEHTGLEEITPKEIEVSILVDIREGHRIGAVQAAELSHDLDALKAILQKTEHGDSVIRQLGHIITTECAVQATEEKIPVAITVDVVEVGNVLAIRKERHTLDVPHGIPNGREGSGTSCAVIAKILHIAEAPLAQKVEITIVVEVDEAGPLPHRQVLISVCTPYELKPVRPADVLEQHQLVRTFLKEEVDVPITVDVDELWTWHVEATKKRRIVGPSVLVIYRKGIDRADELGRPGGGSLFVGPGGRGNRAGTTYGRRPTAARP